MPSTSDLVQFEASLARLTELFASVPPEIVGKKPRPEDWSVKEIACHLIDSASNNHQRFTRLQRTNRLIFPVYEPEPWVAVEHANDMPWDELFGLFRLYNRFILHLVRSADPACLSHVWVVDGEEKSLEFLMRDYYRHLDWHHDHLQGRLRELGVG